MKQSHLGFALPTVLMSSVILMTLLLVAMQGVMSVRQGLDGQYYDQLTREAADAGVQHLERCINKSFETDVALDVTVTYRPNTNCDGTVSSEYSQYLLTTPQYRTTYTATIAGSDAYSYRVRVQAKVEFLRSASNTVWKTVNRSLNADASTGLYSSSKSAIGYYQVCGVIDNRTWCWGKNEDGQLGNGTKTDSLVPVRVARDTGLLAGKVDTSVAVGRNFACNISSNEAYCWGSNERGQLGTGNVSPSIRPVKVSQSTGLAGKQLSNIVATEKTACVIASGDIYCWGDSRYGQLGISVGISVASNTSSAYYRTSPVRVSTIGASVSANLAVTKIAATPNARHICAIVASGDAYCWGGNDNGALGWRLNNYVDQYYPRLVTRSTDGDLGSRIVTDIAVGGWITDGTNEYGSHTCAIAGGRVHCWGANDEGQLGIGSTLASAPGNGYTVPIAVTNNSIPTTGMEQVGVGYWHSCARRASEMWCWGQNYYGELGLGVTGSRRVNPQKLPTTTNQLAGKTITDMSAGVYRVCVTADAATYCWGNNDYGQIGDGTTVTRNTATEAYFLRSKVPSLKF